MLREKFPLTIQSWMCPSRKADTEAFRNVQGSMKRALAYIGETEVEVSKDEVSKWKDELAKEVQEVKISCGPREDTDKDKDKDKKGKGVERAGGIGKVRVSRR